MTKCELEDCTYLLESVHKTAQFFKSAKNSHSFQTVFLGWLPTWWYYEKQTLKTCVACKISSKWRTM